jgi:hypothetical protein
LSEIPTISPRVTAFLEALPLAEDDEFVVVPGLATFRAKYVRWGIEREVVVVHSTGYGFAIAQPRNHVGMCPDCAMHKGSICEHCSCHMCSFFRRSEERSSPPVSREKLLQLVARMKVFRFGTPKLAPALDDDIL